MLRMSAGAAVSCFFVLLRLVPALAQAEQGGGAQASVEAFAVFTAHEYGFDGPDHIPAGVTTIRILNQGHDLHHIQLLRLPPGKSAEEFRATLTSGGGALPNWIRFVGGPNAAVPGRESSATMNLAEGDYVLVCLIPNKDGVPHVALGMQKPLSVRGSRPAGASEPKPTVTVTQSDFQFALSAPVVAGSHIVEVVNRGVQPHEVVLVKLDPGVSAKAFGEALEAGASGPPPGTPIGGVVGIEQGDHGYFTVRFEPGHYGLLCFFPDPATGKPHFAQGMASEFTVK